ncbi:hypothetical protein C1I97_34300 [Streptomyces sp. NTH33]|nr:hypothetical protein C1I97_34300 [Streptomyces sp. NTH33]
MTLFGVGRDGSDAVRGVHVAYGWTGRSGRSSGMLGQGLGAVCRLPRLDRRVRETPKTTQLRMDAYALVPDTRRAIDRGNTESLFPRLAG